MLPAPTPPAALLAMFVEVDAATALVSFGTLIVLWLVCNAQMQRRYYPDVQMRFTRYVLLNSNPGLSNRLSLLRPTLGVANDMRCLAAHAAAPEQQQHSAIAQPPTFVYPTLPPCRQVWYR